MTPEIYEIQKKIDLKYKIIENDKAYRLEKIQEYLTKYSIGKFYKRVYGDNSGMYFFKVNDIVKTNLSHVSKYDKGIYDANVNKITVSLRDENRVAKFEMNRIDTLIDSSIDRDIFEYTEISKSQFEKEFKFYMAKNRELFEKSDCKDLTGSLCPPNRVDVKNFILNNIVGRTFKGILDSESKIFFKVVGLDYRYHDEEYFILEVRMINLENPGSGNRIEEDSLLMIKNWGGGYDYIDHMEQLMKDGIDESKPLVIDNYVECSGEEFSSAYDKAEDIYLQKFLN